MSKGPRIQDNTGGVARKVTGKPHKLLLRAAFLLGLLMTTTVVFAVDVTIDYVDGLFGSPTPATPTCFNSSRNTVTPTTDENQVRWGDAGVNCGSLDNRSGYGFDGWDGGIVTTDTPFYLGKFTHYNNPINATTILQSIPLTYNVVIDGTPFPFTFTATLDETPNNPANNPGGRCPYPEGVPTTDPAYIALNANGCGDKTTFTSLPTTTVIEINGNFYVLEFTSFNEPGANNTCGPEDVNNAPKSEFLTVEQQNNVACLFGKLTFPTTDIAVTKTVNPQANIKPGDTIEYTITYQNTGNYDLTNVHVVDTLPDNMKLTGSPGFTITPNPTNASCVATGGDANGYGATVTCGGPPPANYLDALSPGEVGSTIKLTVLVNPDDNTFAERTNTACARGNLTIPSLNWTSPNTQQECADVTVTTPVTLSYFLAKPAAGGIRFDWSTATETTNAGFNLYRQTADGLEPINEGMIPSESPDSDGPRDYSYEASGLTGEVFYLEDVGLFGENRLHGPFTIGEVFGERTSPEPINWEAIALEHQTLAAQWSATAASSAATLLGGPSIASNFIDSSLYNKWSSTPAIEMRVRQDGIYRVTYEQLLAATGIDFKGIPTKKLAVINQGEPVPRFVPSGRFGPGKYIEFYGEGLDTLYTDTNVYLLQVSEDLAVPVGIDRTRLFRNPSTPAYYLETITVDTRTTYSYLSPGEDPWYHAYLLAQSPQSWDFTLNVDNIVAGPPATLQARLWGASNLIPGPDHHTVISFNGQQIRDLVYDNRDIVDFAHQLPANLLKEGDNTLKLTKPLDQGAKHDASVLKSYAVTYPRAFVSRQGRLDFEATATAFRVTNLPNKKVIVYRLESGRPVRVANIKFQNNNGVFQATFPGSSFEAQYFVSTEAALLKPGLAIARTPANITNGQASLLVIAHPSFIGADLDRWLAKRQSQGYTTKVVDVRDIYATYSDRVFDANAIAHYIRYAIKNMGVKFVVLVGGDTYNYRNYNGDQSISFIPSLYANTIGGVNFAPVDPLYTDVNGDQVPDAAIGRLPVRTIAELKLLIDKTLQYEALSARQSAVFAADVGFEQDSDAFASLVSSWDIEKAYIGLDGNSTARATLINAMNAGPRLASFVGHSSRRTWAPTSLFKAEDVASLTNYDEPMVITQWGCWNTYYVDPTYNTLGHNFLFAGNQGAAVVAGATTLTSNRSERALGQLMMPRLLNNGVPIGTAMLLAKQELAVTNPNMKDVLMGWTILGDPTIVIRP